MNICMAGIDYDSAGLEQREAFAFTKVQAAQAMRSVMQLPGMKGCVVYSTCNRTELWLCPEKYGQTDPAGLLCLLKKLPEADFTDIITVRAGGEAVEHLFETACGLRSRIWGEDQIITQVKEALRSSMAEGAAGRVLGKLFQAAVTCAKKIKTQVHFTSGGSSVAAAAAEKLKEICGGMEGRRCLVIGNGNMGFHMAQELTACGAEVTITLRQYKYGTGMIPGSCGAVAYDDRLAEVGTADIIISATSSPHYTLYYEQVAAACAAKPKQRIFIDLAVPRDMDPRIAGIPDSTLLTIDDIPCRVRTEEKTFIEAECRKIIAHYISEFDKQLAAWHSLPAIQSLAGEFEHTLVKELEKELVRRKVPKEQQENIIEFTQTLVKENACKMLFTFRDWMEENAGERKTSQNDGTRAIHACRKACRTSSKGGERQWNQRNIKPEGYGWSEPGRRMPGL
jgi:glutamyl-tRNA reductase